MAYTFNTMLIWWHYLIVFAVGLLVTTACVPIVRKIAIAAGVVDDPGPRRVNTEPIPRMGGVAMFAGLAAALAVEAICEALGVWNGPFITPMGTVNIKLVGTGVGLLFILAVGIVDDIRSLPPMVKFIGQIVAACVIASSGVLLDSMKIPFTAMHVQIPIFAAYPITVVYLVAFANIINLIDGLDGLAAGISGISALSLFILTVGLDRVDAALLAIALVGICLGFLFYNFHPASIFMGDSGSLLLGMLLGSISLLGAARFSSITALAVPVVIAGVPVIDTFSAIVRRTREHKSIGTPDAGHIHHRLLRQGYSQRKAVLVIYAWTALLSVCAVIIWNVGGLLKYLVLIIVLVISSIVIWRLGLFGPVLKHHYGDSGEDEPEGEQSDDQQ